MNYNFCTLFDKNYLYYGLTLYSSLIKYCPDFTLWILCMDDICYKTLRKMNLKNVRLLRLEDIEDDRLLEAKKNRSVGEYCWTLSSNLTYFLLKNNPELEDMTYVDSDTFFYSSPEPIFKEMGDSSILIIKHNYTKGREYLEKLSGIYNVAFVIFKNNQEGLECLQKWADDCIDWCYNRYEDGKFGDQKYLDYWPDKFKGLCVLSNKGANVAPWNLSNYKITIKNGDILVNEDKLIFYHFHTFKAINENNFQLHSSAYKINNQIEKLIYCPYVEEFKKSILVVRENFEGFNFGFFKKESFKVIFTNKLKRIFLFIRRLKSK